MKDIREVLFAKYSEEVEATPPTETDNIFGYALCEIGTLDADLSDRVLNTATAVINEQMKRAYMAGFGAAVAAHRAITGKA